uniref:NADH-ubiquinone oxidoreductase chain 2 n=1 Tax=Periscepsia handlirschi TaxID=2799180 RepID=A0A7T4X9L2_9MUSC|nr:NADH dehydrogenase subunit 2 [Periscepsia handlirschi]QQD89763.1 NADH dehydrogenase subunit 2 [Periscepsia handlirschi]
MFNNSSKMLFFVILMMGSLISISANTWLSAWMGLEINLLSFMPLMSDNKLMSTESSLKYFLVQALASSVLLFSVILYMMNVKNNNSMNYMYMLVTASLLLKSGSAPFHFWFPSVMEGLTWLNALILLTWQKVAPLMLISYILYKPLIIISIILSSIIGAMGGLNQTSLRKLMAYSSINHLSWMLTAMNNSNLVWMIYFIIYSFMNFTMIYLFNMFKISYINQLFIYFMKSKNMKIFFMLNLMSLGGLPPFLGFLPKLIVIQTLCMNKQFILLTIMIFMSLITLYYYLRLCYSTFMLNYFEINWINKSIFTSNMMMTFFMLTFLSMFGFFIATSLYFNF